MRVSISGRRKRKSFHIFNNKNKIQKDQTLLITATAKVNNNFFVKLPVFLFETGLKKIIQVDDLSFSFREYCFKTVNNETLDD